MRIEFKQSFFLIEGPGVAMGLITEWLAERDQVLERNKALVAEIGVEQYSFDRETGVVTGIVFTGEPPSDWRKPDKHGISYPKKGSPWVERLKNQVGHREASKLIKEALGIPTFMQCADANGRMHKKQIGHWFTPCQFATLGMQPPYLLVIPNVAYYVAEAESEGLTVPPEVKSFKPQFDGCRAIGEDEWDIMTLRHKAAQRKDGEA